MELRKQIGREIARYFYYHLLDEKDKSFELRSHLRDDGKTAEESNQEVLDLLLNYFPTLNESKRGKYNLIEEWAKRNKYVFSYKDYFFDDYNWLFIKRLIAFTFPSPENEKIFKEATFTIFKKIDYNRVGFSISFFLRVENNMREILREIMTDLPNIDTVVAWEYIYEQSKEYQEFVNKVFEDRLQEAIDESNRLLYNIFPKEIVQELKKNKSTKPKFFESATVLFTDFVGFTKISSTLEPEDLVNELDECFSLFDSIIEEFRIEKVKTIGDSYMCVAGLPIPNKTHCLEIALAALKMKNSFKELQNRKLIENKKYWDIRIGFHTGSVVAGVIAKKKFSYDVWGDTVNTASRIESSSLQGEINTSKDSYELLKDFFEFEFRGDIDVKGKGEIPMYFLKTLKKDYSFDGFTPNEKFWEYYTTLKNSE